MKTLFYNSTFFALVILITSCGTTTETENEKTVDTVRTVVELTTTKGTITLELYNETPQHRDNFIKLVNEGQYDSLLFHRVIDGFMIQGGDPESKFAEAGAPLGRGGLGYKVPAEFNKELFHKRGALASARDGNPERASSSIQFYIVQAGPVADSLFAVSEEQINNWLREYYSNHAPENQALLDSLSRTLERGDFMETIPIRDTLAARARKFEDFETYTIPEEHKEVYRTLGGTPFLDQNYTVFGEVLEGLNVVDSIAFVARDPRNRPIEDVRIISARIITP